MKRQPVIVEWRDAHADAEASVGWAKLSDLETTPRLIVTCGWLLLRIKPGHVTVAQSIDAERQSVSDVLHIPRGMVQSIRRL